MDLFKKKKKVAIENVEVTVPEVAENGEELTPMLDGVHYAGKRVIRVTRLESGRIEVQVESLETFSLSQEEFNRDVK
jgi:hypothetical protein